MLLLTVFQGTRFIIDNFTFGQFWSTGRTKLFWPGDGAQWLSRHFTINQNLIMAQEEQSRVPKSLELMLWEAWIFAKKFFFFANPSMSRYRIKYINTVTAKGNTRGKVRGSIKSAGFMLMTQWMSIQNCMVIHKLVVEIFQVWTSYKLLVGLLNTKWRKDLKWKLKSVLSINKLDIYVKKKESKVGQQCFICAICLV